MLLAKHQQLGSTIVLIIRIFDSFVFVCIPASQPRSTWGYIVSYQFEGKLGRFLPGLEYCIVYNG